jgi:O-antigen ligase
MRYVVLAILFILFWGRYFALAKRNQRPNFLFLSFFIQQIPLSCILYKLPIDISNKKGLTGPFDSFYSIDISIGILFLMQVLNVNTSRGIGRTIIKENKKGIFVLSMLLFVALINPYTYYWKACLPVFLRLFQIYMLLMYLSKTMDWDEILKGIYDGLSIAIILQSILVVFYPIMGLAIVTTIFRGDEIGQWAERREGYSSAIGTFMHPGSLALFSTLVLMFFISCRLHMYRSRASLIHILLCVFVIVFTYSRTSYISSFLAAGFLMFIFPNLKKIKVSTILYVFFGVIIVILVVQNTALANLFLKSDSEMQTESRLIHFGLAYEMWQKSKLIGIGLNNHVAFMSTFVSRDFFAVDPFFFENPIHNIHLIILVETGVLGFVVWIYYIISRILKGLRNSLYSNGVGIINLSNVGAILAYVIYGMAGWSGFHREIYPIILLFGFFTFYGNKKA